MLLIVKGIKQWWWFVFSFYFDFKCYWL